MRAEARKSSLLRNVVEKIAKQNEALGEILRVCA